jgi:excinuclease ABC subunit B
MTWWAEINMGLKRERTWLVPLDQTHGEDLSSFWMNSFEVNYLHSEVETLERVSILRDLRMGVFDVIVASTVTRRIGLPESIAGGDPGCRQTGLLRSETALISPSGGRQPCARKSDHVSGYRYRLRCRMVGHLMM